MNNRHQTLQHHEIKVELGINVIDEILNIFNESIIMVPKKSVAIVENTLYEAKQKTIDAYRVAEEMKKIEEQKKAD